MNNVRHIWFELFRVRNSKQIQPERSPTFSNDDCLGTDNGHLVLGVLSAYSALPVVEEVQIEHSRIGRNLGGDSVCRKVKVRGGLLPLSVWPFAGVPREAEFGFCHRDF